MKKIYIATPVDYGNYGNRLQNFAVHRICEKINLEPITLAVEYSYKKIFLPKHLVCKWISRTKFNKLIYKTSGLVALKRSQKSWDFTQHWMKTRYVKNEKYVEKLVGKESFVGVGGDQIWSSYWHKVIPFCNFKSVDATKKICFGPSFGSDSFDENYLRLIGDEISTINSPAVREKSGAKYIKEYSYKDALVICDPVVSLSCSEWKFYIDKDDTKIPSEPFVVTYFLGKPSDETKDWLKTNASDNKLQVIDLSNKTIGKLMTVNPLGFVKLIANSTVLLTDSFHGLMFSLIMNTPAVLFKRVGGEKMNTRIIDVVEKYKIQDYWFDYNKSLPDYFKTDFEYINEVLKCERECSDAYYSSFNTGRLECYRAYNKDENVRYSSSSGGVFSALAKAVLSENGVVYGAELNKSGRIVMKRVDFYDNIASLRGSKYAHVEVGDCFKQIKTDIDAGKKVLFCSTPCKVNGLVKFLGSIPDNLYLVDLICHGSPGGDFWQTYYNYLSCDKKISKVNFRDKRIGWSDYGFGLTYEDKTDFFENRFKNSYMRLFLGNISLRPSCYECRSKGCNRSSCITIGDLWNEKDSKDQGGYTACILHNSKGKKLFDLAKDYLFIEPITISMALNKNINYYRSVGKPFSRKQFFDDYKNKGAYVFENTESYTHISLIEKALRYMYRKMKEKGVIGKEKANINYPTVLRNKDDIKKAAFSCCGCGACEQGCPVNAITMQYDDEGCLYPVINTEICINCGKCEKICSYNVISQN